MLVSVVVRAQWVPFEEQVVCRDRCTHFVVQFRDGLNVLPLKMSLVLDVELGSRPDVGKDGALHSSLPWLSLPTPFQADVVLDHQFVPEYLFFQICL